MPNRPLDSIRVRLDLLLFLTLLTSSSATAQIVITPSTPPVVNQGGSYKFTANVPVKWSMAPGSKGSIDPDGTYHAPAVVTAQQSVGGCQLLPNDHIINTRVDDLPVSANSAAWIASANYGHLIYNQVAPINYSDNATATTKMVFRSASGNNGNFTFPLYPTGMMQGGWWILPYSTDYWNAYNSVDHHMWTVNPTSCHVTEIYKYYPVGTDPTNPTTNSVAGVQYNAEDYALNFNGTTDAAGMEVLPLMIHLQEWENAVNTGGTINHAAHITFRAAAITNNSFLWPATLRDYTGFGAVPFGARVRLKSSFNISGFSPHAQVLLKQLQQYGALLDDTGSDWNVGIDQTKLPYAYQAAIYSEIGNAKISPSNFEFVDESSLEVSAKSGATTISEAVVATNNSGSATQQVVLTGVTLGVPADQMYIQAGTGAQQLKAFVNGTSNSGIAWTMSPTVGTLTSAGLYTPPAAVDINTATTITATSDANPSVVAHITLVVLEQGTIRLMAGQCGPGLTMRIPVSPFDCVTTPYVDSLGNAWQAETGDEGSEELNCGANSPPWPNLPDIGLYKIRTAASQNDLIFNLTVPNGNYLLTGKFANGCSYDDTIGSTAISLEAQGVIKYSNVDVVASAGGPFRPIDFALPTAVTNGHLLFVVRFIKGSSGATISALEIAPVAGATSQSAPLAPPSVSVIQVK